MDKYTQSALFCQVYLFLFITFIFTLMKRLLILLLLLPLFAIAQDTHTLPSGTVQFPAGLRFKAITPDSLNQLWLTNPLTGKANRIYTATESNLLFAPIVGGGYVPTTRTLTIAGVTYDLSANRTWTLSTHSVGYGLAGSNYTGASAQAWRVDTSGSTSPASKPYLQAYAYTKAQSVPSTRTVTAGNGLAGGGALSSNITIRTDTSLTQTVANFFPKGDTRYYTKSTADNGFIQNQFTSAQSGAGLWSAGVARFDGGLFTLHNPGGSTTITAQAGTVASGSSSNIAELVLKTVGGGGGYFNAARLRQYTDGTNGITELNSGNTSTNYPLLLNGGSLNWQTLGNLIYNQAGINTLKSDFGGVMGTDGNNVQYSSTAVYAGDVFQLDGTQVRYVTPSGTNKPPGETIGWVTAYRQDVNNHALSWLSPSGKVYTNYTSTGLGNYGSWVSTDSQSVFGSGTAGFLPYTSQLTTASRLSVQHDFSAGFGAYDKALFYIGSVAPVGNNTIEQGIEGGFIGLSDPAGLSSGQGNNLLGMQIVLNPLIARTASGNDDVTGVVVNNVGTVAGADGYYVGRTKLSGSWGTTRQFSGGSFKTDANSGQAFGASGAYGVGLDFINGATVATFTTAAIRLPNATAIKIRNAANSTEYTALNSNSSDDLLLGNTGPLRITTAGLIGINQTVPAAFLDLQGVNVAGATNYGYRGITNYTSSADLNSSSNFSGYFLNNFNSTGTSSSSKITGVRAGARNINTGSLSEVNGAYIEAVTGNGTVSVARGLLVWVGNQREGGAAVTGTTNTTYGVHVASLANNVSSGTMTTRYGLRVDDVGTGSTFYSAYFGGGKVYTAGNLLIGSTTDDGVNALQVTGSITSSAATASTVATWDASKKLGSTATTGTGSFVRQNIPDFTGGGFNIFSGANNTIFTANGGGNYSINLPALSGTIALTSQLNKLNGYTVATLPAGTVGSIAYVTDALAPTYGATVVGGGAVTAMVFYNGTNWVLQ